MGRDRRRWRHFGRRILLPVVGAWCLTVKMARLLLPSDSSGSFAGTEAALAAASSPGQDRREAEPKNLWDGSATIPPWMKRYFAWHQSERSKLTPENWQSRRYLVQRCLPSDDECGGACDRLGPLPYLLMLANRTNRLLFIHWSRPAALEEFLLPPEGGMNWTIPEAVNFTMTETDESHGQLASNNASHIVADPGNVDVAATDRVVVEARFRGITHLATVHGKPPMAEYDAGRDSFTEATFQQVYSGMWRILFEPSPAVNAIVQSTLKQLKLKPRKYTSVHIRSKHVHDNSGNTKVMKKALRCAAKLKPDAPIYLASDSAEATRLGMDYGRRMLNRTVVAVTRREPLLHLDLGQDFLSWISREAIDWSQYPPSAYYDTFVDLYLLSYGVCTAYGFRSYGRWAKMISLDDGCSIDYISQLCNGPTFNASVGAGET